MPSALAGTGFSPERECQAGAVAGGGAAGRGAGSAEGSSVLAGGFWGEEEESGSVLGESGVFLMNLLRNDM